MPLHSTGSGTISFGLVSIPIKMFTAASSAGVSFNQIHPKCGGRIRQQLICPTCNEVVDRTALVKGYEFAKDQYVQFTEDELKALEGEASKMIDIAEFVPLADVDPIYFEKTYYLGPDKGGEKAYRLLADAMLKSGRVALAQFVMRGKENLVLIRPSRKGLMLHTMYFADEIRDFGEVDKGEDAKVKPGELELAERLVKELSSDSFKPEKYNDDYRERVLGVVEQKVEGKEVTSVAPQAQRAQVIDLMDALKQSLGKRGSRPSAGGDDEEERGAKTAALQKKPAARARRTEEPAPRQKKVQGGKR
ncbi:MAG TPA: Ku protein [Candidatus Eisenbacteria bacterium]|nr:Ku protein [Candidatus Eisenbacteria bacterium]